MWFAYGLTILFLITGFCWLLDKVIFAPKRQHKAQSIREQMDGGYDDAVAHALARPIWLEFTAGLFGVVAVVFVLRSFITEPFRIPSGSMLPTFYIGDFVLVNKFDYGLRMPITNKVFFENKRPQRGEVMVFHSPPEPGLDYIKRVVGIPGDKISYVNKQLMINDQLVVQNASKIQTLSDESYQSNIDRIDLSDITQKKESFSENKAEYEIWLDASRNNYYKEGVLFSQLNNSSCFYSEVSFECTVPADHYFVMGDNRDHSGDSRYWGFVPEANIVGRAYFVWMNFSDFSRIGTLIK